MIEKVIQEIKLILENRESQKKYLEFSYLPPDEAKIFLTSLNNLQRYLIHFTNPTVDKNEIQKWAFIYIALHNLWHSEINNQNIEDIVKLEILTTAPIFHSMENILVQEKILKNDEFAKLSFSYFLLGLTALKINHSLEYLISEKIILGEFVALGGVEKDIWGLQFKPDIMPLVTKNIQNKIEKDTHHLLLKKYKNFVFDFIA
jgi:hypothetical protein